MSPSFADQLEFGRQCEKVVGDILKKAGRWVFLSYEFSGNDENHAPYLFGPNGEKIVYPDIQVYRKEAGLTGARLVEVKGKTNRGCQRHPGTSDPFEHGINLHHYRQYKRVEKITGMPVFLCVVEDCVRGEGNKLASHGEIIMAPISISVREQENSYSHVPMAWFRRTSFYPIQRFLEPASPS